MEANFFPEADLPKKDHISIKGFPFFMHISKNRCGSYTTEWIARVMGMYPVTCNEILRGPVWFDLFRPILPKKMKQLFKSRGMNGVEVDLSSYTDAEKLNWIKREIVLRRKPPALLIRARTLHWIAVAGYDDDARLFYTYNPSYGAYSTTPLFPVGNSAMGYDELLKLWKGRWGIAYRAIVLATNEFKEPVRAQQ